MIDYKILKGNEQLMEEFETNWKNLDPKTQRAAEDFSVGMCEEIPGLRVAMEFLEDGRVEVMMWPPENHPAYDPSKPNACIKCKIGNVR